jgi:hypothetical protein
MIVNKVFNGETACYETVCEDVIFTKLGASLFLLYLQPVGD